MSKQPRLWKRDGTYYLRVRVPDDLRPTLKKREIKQSLKTGNHKEALELMRVASAQADALISEARRKLGDQRTEVSKLELEHMAMLWLHRTEERQVQEAINEAPLNEDELEHVQTDLANELGALKALDNSDDPDGLILVSGVMDELMEENKIKLEPTHPGYKLLFSYVRRVMLENARRRLERLNHRYESTSFDPLFAKVFADRPAPKSAKSITVDQLIERYRKDPARAGLRQGTWGKYEIVFRLMREELGAKTPIRDLAREDFTRLKDMLAVLPPNATKTHPKLKFSEVVEVAKREGLRPMNVVTANNHLSLISTIFRYAHNEDLVDKNRAFGLRITAPDTLPKAERRLPFTVKQLRAIFSAGPFQKARGKRKPKLTRDGKFWVPLLSLWGGLRLNEACQLHVDDIQRKDGVDVIVVRDGGDGSKRVKTEAGRRVVPLHPELIRIGFMDYVAEQRQACHKQLFPELTHSRRGYYSDVFSKWFGRFLKSTGAKQERTTFHSFRHCFRDAMREADIAHGMAKALGGWTDDGTDATYGSGYKASTLAKALAKIKYPGLDLSHLHKH